MNVEWTDDPEDPCAYCVTYDEDGNPVNSMGEVIKRMYRHTHFDCQQAIDLYIRVSEKEQ